MLRRSATFDRALATLLTANNNAIDTVYTSMCTSIMGYEWTSKIIHNYTENKSCLQWTYLTLRRWKSPCRGYVSYFKDNCRRWMIIIERDPALSISMLHYWASLAHWPEDASSVTVNIEQSIYRNSQVRSAVIAFESSHSLFTN